MPLAEAMPLTNSIFALLFFALCLAIQASPVPATLSSRYKTPFSVLLHREGDKTDKDFTVLEKAILYTVIAFSATILCLWLLIGVIVAIVRRKNDKTFWGNFKDGMQLKKDVGYL
ncbi:uncharacterized protein J4E88_007965 [Alternaria novae-zelandiae]|uniref:uncharacterized protein n=1 Tax=Alternaria novae-zelandiae TaxID=430562 RepID=UPI0020C2A003|nr:uncharacterized protein J4E88_007965 [Alternaria novae-zelandiae]KAI4675061.1 hypothetical protein J4E88_007965 [Alternaria novae-zelandiae]